MSGLVNCINLDKIRGTCPHSIGRRFVERFGKNSEVLVLRIESSLLEYGNERYKFAGATSDFPSYQPHITISYENFTKNPQEIKPYTGEIILGPEIQSTVVEDGKEIPGSIYVKRNVLNPFGLLDWTRKFGIQGGVLKADDLHITICYSRTPLNKIVLPDKNPIVLVYQKD